jgi:hypothetical protein
MEQELSILSQRTLQAFELKSSSLSLSITLPFISPGMSPGADAWAKRAEKGRLRTAGDPQRMWRQLLFPPRPLMLSNSVVLLPSRAPTKLHVEKVHGNQPQ